MNLVVPKADPEIGSVLDHTTRGVDLKIQNYQKTLYTATYALTNIWQTVFTSDSPEIRGLIKDVAYGTMRKMNLLYYMHSLGESTSDVFGINKKFSLSYTTFLCELTVTLLPAVMICC